MRTVGLTFKNNKAEEPKLPDMTNGEADENPKKTPEKSKNPAKKKPKGKKPTETKSEEQAADVLAEETDVPVDEIDAPAKETDVSAEEKVPENGTD